MNKAEPSGEAIKSQIDELRREWDRLDSQGTQSVGQAQVARDIERLQKQLKAVTGEDY